MSDNSIIIISSDEEYSPIPNSRTQVKKQISPSTPNQENNDDVEVLFVDNLNKIDKNFIPPKIVSVKSCAKTFYDDEATEKSFEKCQDSYELQKKEEENELSSGNTLEESITIIPSAKTALKKEVHVPSVTVNIGTDYCTPTNTQLKTVQPVNINTLPMSKDKTVMAIEINPVMELPVADNLSNKHDFSKITKDTPKKMAKTTENDKNIQGSQSEGNLSGDFKMFLGKVLTLEEKEDDRNKLEKKIMKYYNMADPPYLESQEFKELLKNGLRSLNQDPFTLYFIVKDLLDNLVQKRVINYKKQDKDKLTTNLPFKEKDTQAANDHLDAQERKKYMTIKKLERTLKILHNKIKQLEDAEVDLSDEEDSTYFKMQRYRQRFCLIYKKICEYTGQVSDAKRVYSKKIHFSDTKYAVLNIKIENWLNKTKKFPDYADVYKFVEAQSKPLSLNLSKEGLRALANKIFVKVGEMLQRRRKYDVWDSFNSFLDNTEDPALNDQDLESALKKNQEYGAKRVQKIINYFAEKQDKDKLEPCEVSDEDDSMSPVESSDEDEKEIEEYENVLDSILDSKISCEEIDAHTQDSDEENLGNTPSSPGPKQRTCSQNITQSDRSSMSEAVSTTTEHSNFAGEKKIKEEGKCVGNEKIDTYHTKKPRPNDLEKNVSPGLRYTCDGSSGKSAPNANELRNVSVVNNIRIYLNECQRDKNEINCSSGCSYGKRISEIEEAEHTKKCKLTKRFESNSDCEIIDILSDEDNENSKNIRGSSPRMHQINFVFVNKSFFSNPAIFRDGIWSKRTSKFYSNFKPGKKRFDVPPLLPFIGETSFKNVSDFYSQQKGSRQKHKSLCILKKTKNFNYIKKRPIERLRCRQFKSFPIAEVNRRCSIRNVVDANDSVKKDKDTEDNEQVQNNNKGRNPEECNTTLDAMSHAGNGAVGGGEDDDSGENNKKRKPPENGDTLDEEKKVEDDEEEEEDDEEARDNNPSENIKIKYASETNRSTNAVPKSENTHCATKEDIVCSETAPHLLVKDVSVSNEDRSDGDTLIVKSNNSEKTESETKLNVVDELTTKEDEEPVIISCKVNEIVNSNEKRFKPAKRKVIEFDSRQDFESEMEARKNNFHTPKRRPSDEEIVRNFLRNSPVGISITTPKQRAVSAKPSESVREALAMLKRLKGISATIVKRKHSVSVNDDEVVVLGESKHGKSVNAGSSSNFTPKIVSVEGNVSGFDDFSTTGQHFLHQSIVRNSTAVVTPIHSQTRSVPPDHTKNSVIPRRDQNRSEPSNPTTTSVGPSLPRSSSGCVEPTSPPLTPRRRQTRTGSQQSTESKNVEFVVLD